MFNSPLVGLLRLWIPPISSWIWRLVGVCFFFTLAAFQLPSLVLSTTTLNQGAIWAPLTAPFVLYPHSPLFIILILGWMIYAYGGVTSRQGKIINWVPFIHLAVGVVALGLIEWLIPQLNPWSFIITLFMLNWFARPLERQWGSHKWFMFSLTLLVLPFLCATVLCLMNLTSLSFKGMSSLERGFLIAWALQQNRRTIPFLNVRGRTLAWIILGFCLLEMLLSNFHPTSLLGFMGACTSWILIEELWNPKELKKRWVRFQKKAMKKSSKKGLRF